MKAPHFRGPFFALRHFKQDLCRIETSAKHAETGAPMSNRVRAGASALFKSLQSDAYCTLPASNV